MRSASTIAVQGLSATALVLLPVIASGPAAAFASEASAIAPAACIKLNTAADLDNIRNKLSGNYCLADDIDLGSISSFVPIGQNTHRFTGTLDGRGHVIRN